MKLLDNAKAINAAIDSISRRGKTLDQDIQLAAVSCLNHHNEHGDITLLNRLWLGMPKGSRRKSLTDWILAFGAVAPNVDKESKAVAPFVDARKDKAFELQDAIGNPLYEFNRPVDEDTVAEFDFTKALEALLKRAQNAQAKGILIVGAAAFAELNAKYTK